MTRYAPHSDIRNILTETLDVLGQLTARYTTKLEEQEATIDNIREIQNNNESGVFASQTDEIDELSYKLDYLYYVTDLIQSSPWLNPTHSLYKGTF